MKMITISGNCPSSKNSKVKTRTGFIVHSKQCQVYYKLTKKEWEDGAKVFKEIFKNEPKPYYVGFYYVRKSKHKFDFVNPNQTTLDQMVKYGWLDDDNADEILPVFLGYHHDKDAPCTHIVNCGPTHRGLNDKLKQTFKTSKDGTGERKT